MNSHHAFDDRMRFSSIEEGEAYEERESSHNENRQQTSRCRNIGNFIDHSLRCISPSRFDVVPYIHVVIVVIAHVLLYGGVSYWIENTPEYLHDTLLAAVLSSNDTLRSIKVASVSIGVILFFDLVVDVIQSMIGYYKAEETTQQITFRAKEWTVRTLFILSLVEPACVMLIVPPVPTTPVVIFAYCSAFAKNITFVCMGVFCLSNTFDKTPKEYFRSFLLSTSFATGQIFMHYAAMTNQTAEVVLFSQVGLLLSCLPLVLYFYNCMYFLRQIWLKTRREGGFSNVSLREYTFLAYAVSTCLGIVITLIVVFGFNGLYYYNSVIYYSKSLLPLIFTSFHSTPFRLFSFVFLRILQFSSILSSNVTYFLPSLSPIWSFTTFPSWAMLYLLQSYLHALHELKPNKQRHE